MTIEEIQKAVKELSPNDLVLFRKWFAEFDMKFRELNTPQPITEEHFKNLRGSLKGKGVLKAFMDEKKHERNL